MRSRSLKDHVVLDRSDDPCMGPPFNLLARVQEGWTVEWHSLRATASQQARKLQT
jgi:hypothetical protein